MIFPGQLRLVPTMLARPPHLHAAAYLFITKGPCLLLGKRLGTGFRDGQWCLPGGHVDPGERIRQAAAREAEEELGIKTSEVNQPGFLTPTYFIFLK